MGRYTNVRSFSDNNENVAKVKYSDIAPNYTSSSHHRNNNRNNSSTTTTTNNYNNNKNLNQLGGENHKLKTQEFRARKDGERLGEGEVLQLEGGGEGEGGGQLISDDAVRKSEEELAQLVSGNSKTDHRNKNRHGRQSKGVFESSQEKGIEGGIDSLLSSGAASANRLGNASHSSHEHQAPKLRVDMVENTSGSTAGAGSANFHIYRNHRRREYARLEKMDQVEQQERQSREYAQRMQRNKEEAAARTARNAEKRAKRKEKERLKGKRTLKSTSKQQRQDVAAPVKGGKNGDADAAADEDEDADEDEHEDEYADGDANSGKDGNGAEDADADADVDVAHRDHRKRTRDRSASSSKLTSNSNSSFNSNSKKRKKLVGAKEEDESTDDDYTKFLEAAIAEESETVQAMSRNRFANDGSFLDAVQAMSAHETS